MPEMTAMPILPVAVAPANPAQVSGNRTTPTENTKPAASMQGMESSDANSGAGTVQNDTPDSFAQVLQKQMDGAAVPPQAAAKPMVEAAQIFAPDELPVLDETSSPLADAALALDTVQRSLLSAPDASPQNLPAVALAQHRETIPTAAPVADTSLIALPGMPARAEIVAKDSGLLVKPDDQGKAIGDDASTGASPYPVAILAQPAVRLDQAAAAETGESSAEVVTAAQVAAGRLVGALQMQKQAPLPDSAPNLAETSPLAADKTAEFAATLNVLDDVGQKRPKSEALSIDSDFQTLLAAAHAFSQGRTAGAHASGSSQAPSRLPVDTPVGSHGWDGEVGNKVIWMIGRQEQRAELVLNPPQLGRVEVSLSMNATQTNAVFVSANPAVRDALEAAMPRLREILADAGINLGQAQVGADTSSNGAANQSTNQRESWDNPERAMNRPDSASTLESLRPLASPQWLKQSNGLVDVFA